MKVCLIIVLLALRQAHTKSYNVTYVLSWLGGICKVLGPQCDLAKHAQWDHQSFTMQELQVDHQTDKYYGPFNRSLVKINDFLVGMYSFWPPQLKTNGDPYFLWSRPWDKFGHKMLSIIQKEMPAFQQQLQNNQAIYFAVAIEQVIKGFEGSRKLKASTFTLQQFARMLNISYRSIHPVCSKDGTLTNIKVCMQLEIMSEFAFLRQISPRGCIPQERQETCKSSDLFLEDWRQDYEITFKNNSYYRYNESMAYCPLESQVKGVMGRLYSEMQITILGGFLFTCTVVAVSACWICVIVAYLKQAGKKQQHLTSSEPSQVSRESANVELAEGPLNRSEGQPR